MDTNLPDLTAENKIGDLVTVSRNGKKEPYTQGRICHISLEAHICYMMRYPEVLEWKTIYVDHTYDIDPRYMNGQSRITFGLVKGTWKRFGF